MTSAERRPGLLVFIVLVTGAEEYASLAAEVEAMSRLLADGEWGSPQPRRDVAAPAKLMYRRALDHASHVVAALGADQFRIDRFCSRVEQPAGEQTRPANAVLSYLLITSAAVNLARTRIIRRALSEEMIDYRTNQETPITS
ncbi:hypothetical protein [Gordonia sputi]